MANQQSAGDAIMNAINETPPVTRFYAGLTFVVSLASLGLKIIDPYHLMYHSYFILSSRPQLWRCITAFFLTRPKLAIIFNAYWLYDYGQRLERTKFRWSGEFILYLVFVGGINLLLDSLIFNGGGGYAENICVALIYTWAQENRNQLVKFWFVTMKAQWYPFAYVVVAMIMDGPNVGKSLCLSIVAAHLYEFLTRIYPRFGGGRNFLETPRFLQFNFTGGPVGGVQQANSRQQQMQGGSGGTTGGRTVGQGTGFSSGGGRTTSSSTGSGSASSFWRSRGQGQRLGSS